MNFVCTVFEQGDEMLTLLSMKKNNGRMQPSRYTWCKICIIFLFQDHNAGCLMVTENDS